MLGAEIQIHQNIRRSNRRIVSVFYADIVGSSKLISSLNPDEATEILDPIINKMVEAVHAYGGNVMRVQGDGIKAVFGATHSKEDHALRAVCAGLKLLNLIGSGLSELEAAVPLRIGVHSGDVIVRWQSNDFGGGLDTIGSTANIAAKIEQIAATNRVTISDATANLIHEDVQLINLENAEIHDIQGCGALYEVMSIGKENAFISSLDRQQSPLIGRGHELKKLTALLIDDLPLDTHDHNSSAHNCIVLTGIAGIGKTRLVNEAALIASSNNIKVVITGGVSVFRHTPYYVVNNLIRKILGISDRLSFEDTQAFVQQLSLTDHQSTVMKVLFLSENTSFDHQDLSEDDLLITIQIIVAEIFKYIASNEKFLLIIEDLHAIDQESIHCLKYASHQLNHLPFKMLITSRPIKLAPYKQFSSDIIELKPLPETASKTLINYFFKSKSMSISSEMQEALLERSKGLPLALFEFAKISNTSDQLPMALEPLLRQKFDELSDNGLKIAKYASVLGDRITVELLEKCSGLDGKVFSASLKNALHHNVMKYSKEGYLGFEHHLYQEVGYNSLVKQEKSDIHSDVYKCLCQIKATKLKNAIRIDQQVLAFHAEKSEQYETALDHLWAACGEASDQAAIRSVRSLYYRAADICEKLGKKGIIRQVRFALKCFDAFHQLVREEELFTVLVDANENLMDEFEPPEQAFILSSIAFIRWTGGKSDELNYARLANQKADAIGYFPISIYTNFILSNIEHANGLIRDAVNRVESLQSQFTDENRHQHFGQTIIIPYVMNGTFGCTYSVDLGEYELAKHFLTQAREVATEQNHKHSMMLCDLTEGYRHLQMGNPDMALKPLRRAYIISNDNFYLSVAGVSVGWLCQALLNTGNIIETGGILKKITTFDHFSRIKNQGEYYVLTGHGLYQYHIGMVNDAYSYLERALAISVRNGDPVHQAYGHYELGKLIVNTDGPLIKANNHFDMAREFAHQCGMILFEKKVNRQVK